MALDLSGVWKCDDRGLYFIRQDGTTIWWCGLSTDRTLPQYGLEFANVFTGTLDGLRLDGTWSDVPRGATEGHGSLSLSVIIDQDGGPRNLVKGSDTGGFSGANWTFVRLHFVPLAPTTAELFDLGHQEHLGLGCLRARVPARQPRRGTRDRGRPHRTVAAAGAGPTTGATGWSTAASP